MTEYFATREGMIEVIKQNLGGDAEGILDAINDYKSQFVYKCHYSWCTLRRKGGVRSHGLAGFKSIEDLETHRLTHPSHELRDISFSVISTPNYECSCGHRDTLNDEELDLYFEGKFKGEPESRQDHLTKVQKYAMMGT